MYVNGAVKITLNIKMSNKDIQDQITVLQYQVSIYIQ